MLHDFLVFNGLLLAVICVACFITYCMRLWFAIPYREEKSMPLYITKSINVDKVKNNGNPIFSSKSFRPKE